jgi:integrase
MQVKPLYPKRHRPPKRTGITETEFNTLLANAQTPFLRMALVILVGTGLRAGEAVALRWNKVDLDKGIVPHGPLRKMGQDKAARTRSGCD